MRFTPRGGWTVTLTCDDRMLTIHVPAHEATNSYDAVTQATVSATRETPASEIKFNEIYADLVGEAADSERQRRNTH